MDSYKILIKPAVEKDLRRLPKPTVTRILAAIEKLGVNPFPNRTVKLESAEELFRIRVGDYRVVYEVDGNARQVIIHHVRHRREVYRKL